MNLNQHLVTIANDFLTVNKKDDNSNTSINLYNNVLRATKDFSGSIERMRIPVHCNITNSYYEHDGNKYKCNRSRVIGSLFTERVAAEGSLLSGDIMNLTTTTFYDTHQSYLCINRFFEKNTYVGIFSTSEAKVGDYGHEQVCITHDGKIVIGKLEMIGEIPIGFAINNLPVSNHALVRGYFLWKVHESKGEIVHRSLPEGIEITGDRSQFDIINHMDKIFDVIETNIFNFKG